MTYQHFLGIDKHEHHKSGAGGERRASAGSHPRQKERSLVAGAQDDQRVPGQCARGVRRHALPPAGGCADSGRILLIRHRQRLAGPRAGCDTGAAVL